MQARKSETDPDNHLIMPRPVSVSFEAAASEAEPASVPKPVEIIREQKLVVGANAPQVTPYLPCKIYSTAEDISDNLQLNPKGSSWHDLSGQSARLQAQAEIVSALTIGLHS